MKYFDLLPIYNTAKSSVKDDPVYLDENRLGHQVLEVKDLSDLKIPTQLVKGNLKLADFYYPSSDLAMRHIVSDRARMLLESLREGNIRFYPCPLKHGIKDINDYWITDIVVFDDEWIDFGKTVFEFNDVKIIEGEAPNTKRYQDNVELMKFKNYDELCDFKYNRPNHLSKLSFVTIEIKEACPFPILTFRSMNTYSIVINEGVMAKIKSLGMDRGIVFKPFEIPYKKWPGPFED
ncbi:hypothetical protein FHS59_001914 [Algoriphagus iocasae]|jgi:hypothetical protein|uniref:Immunity protein 43 domain-containing protein n=1 Tax=Algoriphagus iocasae TaxID=1836499 RepID=A0A841MQ33_9BACT|nr:hypothetical protein [Algoriphagus iocasae]MBB6326286.1 hypothetical protein [Algoriphagus iocasae]